MDSESGYFPGDQAKDLDLVVEVLRNGRSEILRDWVDRVRDNSAVQRGQTLSDPLLLDHIPNLFDAIVDRLEVSRSRQDAEHAAAVHGFTRRISGYDIVETVVELLMFRRSIWTHLTAVETSTVGAYAAMERIDGMVDRSVIASLRAFLDPAARILRHRPLDEARPEDRPESPGQE